ncbi:hypothetical protein FOXYSP1_18872 [Fusarium oxysporum f. sp. phaseoli]
MNSKSQAASCCRDDRQTEHEYKGPALVAPLDTKSSARYPSVHVICALQHWIVWYMKAHRFCHRAVFNYPLTHAGRANLASSVGPKTLGQRRGPILAVI